MDKQTFTRLIETYGSRQENWPETERPAMVALAAADAEARAALAREAALDGWLDDRLPDLSAPLHDRLMADISAHFAAAAPKAEAPAPSVRWLPSALAMAACLLAGVFSAPPLIEFMSFDSDLLAALQLAGDDLLLN